MGCSIPEAQERVDSREFFQWMIYLQSEPDIGTRVDWLATSIVHHLSRIEATLGGDPITYDGKKICQWGVTGEEEPQESDLSGLKEALKSLFDKANKDKK